MKQNLCYKTTRHHVLQTSLVCPQVPLRTPARTGARERKMLGLRRAAVQMQT
jgi:hypothetical protein